LARSITPKPTVNPPAAITRMLIGAALCSGITRLVSVPLVAGWTGLLGLILFLHFGLFDLLVFAWQSAGVRAEPIMRAPADGQVPRRVLGERAGSRVSRSGAPGVFYSAS